MTALDPVGALITLLSENWNTNNTSGANPRFIRSIDKKTIQFGKHKFWAIVRRANKNKRPAGIGAQAKHLEFPCTIDLRGYGRKLEEQFLEVTEEIERILEANINLVTTDPDNDFDHIDPDGDFNDLSEDTHDVFRVLIPVKLIKYNVARGT